MSGPDCSARRVGLLSESRVLSFAAICGVSGRNAHKGAGRVWRAARATSIVSELIVITGTQHGASLASSELVQHSISSESQHGVFQLGTPVMTTKKMAANRRDRMFRNLLITCKTNIESLKKFFLILGHTIRTEAR